jgi:hypothetical protein
MNLKTIAQLKMFVCETGSLCVGIFCANEGKSGKYKGESLLCSTATLILELGFRDQ